MTDDHYVFSPHSHPPAGPCAFCGYPDKRHRMWDTIRGRFQHGESLMELAEDFRYTPAQMEQWLRLALTAPKKKNHPAITRTREAR